MNTRFEAKFIAGIDPANDHIVVSKLVTEVLSKIHRTPDLHSNVYKIVVEKDDSIVRDSPIDDPSTEKNKDKPGIGRTVFNVLLNKEDFSSYHATKLIEELHDYSRNFVKVKNEELFKLKVRYNEALIENQKTREEYYKYKGFGTTSIEAAKQYYHNRHNRLLNDEPLGDWISYNDYKAEIAYKEQQERDLATWASLDEEGRKRWAKEKERTNNENTVKFYNYLEEQLWYGSKQKEIEDAHNKEALELFKEENEKVFEAFDNSESLKDIKSNCEKSSTSVSAYFNKQLEEIQKQKEELYKRHEAKIAEIRKQYPLTPEEVFPKKENKFINWINKILKKC